MESYLKFLEEKVNKLSTEVMKVKEVGNDVKYLKEESLVIK